MLRLLIADAPQPDTESVLMQTDVSFTPVHISFRIAQKNKQTNTSTQKVFSLMTTLDSLLSDFR